MNPDKLFKNYLKKKITGKNVDFEQFEKHIPDYYDDWAAEPDPVLGGESPQDYFSSCNDSNELLAAAFETIDEGEDPDNMLFERLIRLPGARKRLLCELNGTDSKHRQYAARVLADSTEYPADEFLDIAVSDGEDDDLKDIIIESLKGRDEIKDYAFSKVPGLSDDGKKILAEILITCMPDDRTLSLLTDILFSGDVCCACDLASKYGDGRITESMQTLLETCPYADFLELRSAITTLGGEVTITRNFEEDADYIKIKHDSADEG